MDGDRRTVAWLGKYAEMDSLIKARNAIKAHSAAATSLWYHLAGHHEALESVRCAKQNGSNIGAILRLQNCYMKPLPNIAEVVYVEKSCTLR